MPFIFKKSSAWCSHGATPTSVKVSAKKSGKCGFELRKKIHAHSDNWILTEFLFWDILKKISFPTGNWIRVGVYATCTNILQRGSFLCLPLVLLSMANTHLLDCQATASQMYRPKGSYFGNNLSITLYTNLSYDLTDNTVCCIIFMQNDQIFIITLNRVPQKLSHGKNL